MGFFKDLSKKAMTKTAKLTLEKSSKAAVKWSGEALDKLDMLGGRARDSVVGYWEQTEPWREKVKTEVASRLLRPEQEGEAESQTEIEPEVAPKKQGLGDPEVAVQVFSKKSCTWCHRALRLLEEANIEAKVIQLDDQGNAYLGPQLVSETEQTSVPYIYIRGEFIGGYNELDKLQRLGELEKRLLPR